MNKKILIVEDDAFLQRLASKKMTENGYQVSMAPGAIEAFEMLKKEAPDMILLDLLLPGTDGFEVLAKLKQDQKLKNIPVIVFSNLSGEGDIKKCQDLGIRDFIVKSSCTLNELVDKVNNALK